MVTLQNGKLKPNDFMNEIFLTKEKQDLTKIAKIEPYKVPASFTEMDPNFPCSIHIFMKNGKKLEKIIKNVKGGLNRPLNIEDLRIKFLECSKNEEFLNLLIISKYENGTKFIEKMI